MALHHRTCPLCEATCGLAITVEDQRVTLVRGDRDDPFSEGYLCPKGAVLGELHHDPDRLHEPMVRDRTTNQWRTVSWDEAFAEVDRRLMPVLDRYGRQALGVYVGNPTVHNLSLLYYVGSIIKASGTTNQYSAGTVDQIPKQVAVGLMFGTTMSIPVPDVDRTDHLLVLGANPSASNGSFLTAPDLQGRLDAIVERGGKVVVVDPRRTRSAERASEWVPLRPGTDALLLLAMVNVLFTEDLVRPGAIAEHVNGLDAVRDAAEGFTPEAVAPHCGVPADGIRRLARDLAAAPTAAVYGRIGTCTQAFGTLASWLVDVLNVLTGNLDRPGGAMFAKPLMGAANTRGRPGVGKPMAFGRWRTRVRELPEVIGQLPASALAEEIDTPGDGRIRAMVTVAGNPALSVPDSARLQAALASLDCLISLDCYLNETTRHADVILPGVSPLEQGHFDGTLWAVAVRHYARWSDPVFPPRPPGRPEEWEVAVRLAAVLQGQGPDVDVAAHDDAQFYGRVAHAAADPTSPIHGRDVEEIVRLAGDRRGPERIVDFQLRTGPYGDGYGANAGGLSLDELRRHPHGLDLGPLEPRVPEVLRTPSGRIELAPDYVLADLARLRSLLDGGPPAPGSMVLVGRRHVRSNNSWMHNVELLVKGRDRCTLLVNPDDAARLGLTDGGTAKVASRVGAVVATVEVSDEMMPGVVSLPHGWGHGQEGTRLRVAAERPGVNSNVLADPLELDVPSGNAVVNGIPVELTPA